MLNCLLWVVFLRFLLGTGSLKAFVGLDLEKLPAKSFLVPLVHSIHCLTNFLVLPLSEAKLSLIFACSFIGRDGTMAFSEESFLSWVWTAAESRFSLKLSTFGVFLVAWALARTLALELTRLQRVSAKMARMIARVVNILVLGWSLLSSKYMIDLVT
jgi:hypothetical protein